MDYKEAYETLSNTIKDVHEAASYTSKDLTQALNNIVLSIDKEISVSDKEETIQNGMPKGHKERG